MSKRSMCCISSPSRWYIRIPTIMNVLKEDFLSVFYKFCLVSYKPGQVILETAWNNVNVTESDLALTELLTYTHRSTCFAFLF